VSRINAEYYGERGKGVEERILFKSGGQEIEGLLDVHSAEWGVVITHPHPLYGGDMDNPVVVAIKNAYQAKGYATLRFNFRGVGGSGGTYDSGIGEQEDVRSALAYLQGRGVKHIDLAGYSFGTHVNAEAIRNGAVVERMIMVSPPVAMMEFREPLHLSSLKLVITGSRDDIAPPGLVKQRLPAWNPDAELVVIEGADHFYSGHMKQLEAVLLARL
jgi:alpha/beta superfamily hydrolase